MILRIYAIRDSATAQYGNPMFLMADGQAIRSISDEVNSQDKNNMLSSHPEHFELFKLGQYDTLTGMFETHLPESILTLKSLVSHN